MPTGILVGAAISTFTVGLTTGAVFIGGHFATHFLVTAAMGAALQALAPKPTASGANRGYDTNSIGPAQDHQIIYGKMKVGGAIVFDEATGNNNKFLHRVIAVAGHEVESFDGFYLNDDLISATVGGYLVSENYNKEARDFPESTFQSGRYYSLLPDGVGTEFPTYEELQDFLFGGGGVNPILVAFASMRERLVRINTHNGSTDQLADADLVKESTSY